MTDHTPCGLKQQTFILAPPGGFGRETEVCAGPAPSGGSGKSPSLLPPLWSFPAVLALTGPQPRHGPPATFPLHGCPHPEPPLTGTAAAGIRAHPNPVRPRLNSVTAADPGSRLGQGPGAGAFRGHRAAGGGGQGCPCCPRGPGRCLRRLREPVGSRNGLALLCVLVAANSGWRLQERTSPDKL